MDYEVDYATLRATGQRATLIAGAAASSLNGLRLDGVGDAIPGGVSGGVADWLDASWVEAAAELNESLAGYATALESTATNYRLTEESSTNALSNFFGGI